LWCKEQQNFGSGDINNFCIYLQIVNSISRSQKYSFWVRKKRTSVPLLNLHEALQKVRKHPPAMANPMFPWGNMPLSQSDPEIAELIEREKNRQWRGLELIASEVLPHAQ